MSSEKYPFDQHVEFGLGKRLEAKETLETKEPLWRLTRKWAVRRQWGSGCRGSRLTARGDAAVETEAGVEHLADSQDPGPGGR